MWCDANTAYRRDVDGIKSTRITHAALCFLPYKDWIGESHMLLLSDVLRRMTDPRAISTLPKAPWEFGMIVLQWKDQRCNAQTKTCRNIWLEYRCRTFLTSTSSRQMKRGGEASAKTCVYAYNYGFIFRFYNSFHSCSKFCQITMGVASSGWMRSQNFRFCQYQDLTVRRQNMSSLSIRSGMYDGLSEQKESSRSSDHHSGIHWSSHPSFYPQKKYPLSPRLPCVTFEENTRQPCAS
jgi:hypothetical protein